MIKQSSFEEWPLETSAFDVVVSASAFHWVQPEVGYQKVADALGDDGYFVLLWNKEPQTTSDVWLAESGLVREPSLSGH